MTSLLLLSLGIDLTGPALTAPAPSTSTCMHIDAAQGLFETHTAALHAAAKEGLPRARSYS